MCRITSCAHSRGTGLEARSVHVHSYNINTQQTVTSNVPAAVTTNILGLEAVIMVHT